MLENIIIRGARTHNLKNINLDLPKNKLIVITGLSGSGKSSFISQSMNSKIQVNENPLPWNEGFIIEGACANNLKHINVTIPKGVLTAITGVAGSGKSSLMTEAFIPRNPNCIVIDQKQIGTSIRSTPATYVGIMDEIRKIFAKENCA